jgi:hypothetical protein
VPAQGVLQGVFPLLGGVQRHGQRLFLKRQGRLGPDPVDRRDRSHGDFLARGFIELARDVAVSPLVFHIVGRHRKIPVSCPNQVMQAR